MTARAELNFGSSALYARIPKPSNVAICIYVMLRWR